jgi:hypothetical protein
VIYATDYDNSPYSLEINVYPGKVYLVSVEVLRNGLGNDDDKVSKIRLNGNNIGTCNPDGSDTDCTFYDCDSTLTEKEFSSNSETLTFKLDYVGNSESCSCDTSTWECSSNMESDEVDSPTAMTAVARITLTPAVCKIFHKLNSNLLSYSINIFSIHLNVAPIFLYIFLIVCLKRVVLTIIIVTEWWYGVV